MFCSKCGAKNADDAKFCAACGNKLAMPVQQAAVAADAPATTSVAQPITASATALPEGQELLNGLYVVQDYLQRTSDKLDKFWELERYYRSQKAEKKTVETRTVTEKSQYGLFMGGIALSIALAICGLITMSAANAVVALVATALFAVGRTSENKKLLYGGGIVLALLLIELLTSIARIYSTAQLNGNMGSFVFYILIYVIGFAVGGIIAAKLLKKYNTKVVSYNVEVAAYNADVDAYNANVTAQRQQISAEITQLTTEMKDKTGSWYPTDYYVLDVVEQFIKLVRNHEVDTVKEMVSVYKQDKYREGVVGNLSQMNDKLDQSLYNQEKMIKLQKTANLLLMGNLVANLATASNTASIASKMDQVSANTARAASAAQQTASASESAASAARRTASASEYIAGHLSR